MITRTLDSSGITASAFGAGCWGIGGPDNNLGLPMGWGPVDEAAASTALELAYERGVSLFDTADVYGHGRSERLIGKLVEQVPRSSLVLSTKVGYFSGTAPHSYHPRHMRHQLEQSLDNLATDYIDIYFLHHSEFGRNDVYLEPAVEAMEEFRRDGLIRAVGMRGPHRFALERLTDSPRADKVARFRTLFDLIRPQVLAVRDNLLTPQDRSSGIFDFADRQHCGVLVNKPLSQGLLTGSYDPRSPRTFGDGDHRSRKRWFGTDPLREIASGLEELRRSVGMTPESLIRLALWSCLQQSDNAVVLVGFTKPEQMAMNLEAFETRPTPEQLSLAREIMSRVQLRLDAGGEVFVDERTARSAR